MYGNVLIIEKEHSVSFDNFINNDIREMIQDLERHDEETLKQIMCTKCADYEAYFNELKLYSIAHYFEQMKNNCQNNIKFDPHLALIILENYLDGITYYYI